MANPSSETKSTRRGRESYSSVIRNAKRKARQHAADDRQIDHDSLTLSERIEKAKSRRGESKREIARLEKLIANPKGKKNVPA